MVTAVSSNTGTDSNGYPFNVSIVAQAIASEAGIMGRQVNVSKATQTVVDVYEAVAASSNFQRAIDVYRSDFELSTPLYPGNNDSAYVVPSFGFVWQSAGLQIQEFWEVTLAGEVSLQNSSEPLVASASTITGHSWAGGDVHNSSGVEGATATFIDVPTVSSPPSGTKVVGTVYETALAGWVGISPDLLGGGGLVQTGFQYLVGSNSGSDVTTFYEDFGCGCGINNETPYTSSQCYLYTYTKSGDSFGPEVWLELGDAEFFWYDSTSGADCSASYGIGGYNPGYAPYYAQFVFEAPSFSGLISQVAKFTSTTFTSPQYEEDNYAGSWVRISGEYNAGNWNSYNLNQYPNNPNTYDAHGVYSSDRVVMSWLNSDYNYTYVNG